MVKVLVDRHKSKDNVLQKVDELKELLLDVEGKLERLELGSSPGLAMLPFRKQANHPIDLDTFVYT